jgi:hypothetical protein
MRFISLVLALILIAAASSVPQTKSDNWENTRYTIQPTASDTLRWTNSVYATKLRTNSKKYARGLEIKGTTSGGNISLHLIDDPAGKRLIYVVPAGAGMVQRIPMVFDTIDSAGTTILKTDIMAVWY